MIEYIIQLVTTYYTNITKSQQMSDLFQKILENFSDTAETSLLDRFKAIIDYETHETRRWKELEELTGITTHSWRQAYLGKQRPTAEMLEGVALHWPKYAFWMMTGITDLDGHHICPANSNPWPSAPKDLEDADGYIAWPDLIKLKPYLKKFMNDEPMAASENARFNEMLNQLQQRLIVGAAYRQVMIKKQLKDLKANWAKSRKNDEG